MGFASYAVSSAAAAAAAVYYAWSTRPQFYSTVVFLTTNKFAVLALGNLAAVLTLLAGRVAKRVFLGALRGVEVEILYENSRFAVTETCLALTIFREEITGRVLAMFTGLLFVKAFHWLVQARVEHIEQSEAQRATAHVRLVCLMVVLAATDVEAIRACITVLLSDSPSMLILFAFEFAALAVLLASTAARYALYLVDSCIEGTWHGKAGCIFFVEFVTEALQFLIYLVFFVVVATNYGMPLHIIRDLWVSYTTLRRRLRTFHRYRKLTANMNERFPDATPDELAACEHTCIICRDAMDRGKKLGCGHIFHFQCLRSWLQQQQSCPTCRADIPADVPTAAAAAGAAAVAREAVADGAGAVADGAGAAAGNPVTAAAAVSAAAGDAAGAGRAGGGVGAGAGGPDAPQP
ncbi:unnamed protein product, partial [Phaeothamnion confervicola]